jgi:hypothetical protein
MGDGAGLGTELKRMTQEELAAGLRKDILDQLPNGAEWLKTPHPLLGGHTPEEKISAGDLNPVRQLLHSILYVGIM